jgi:hypothetical protein
VKRLFLTKESSKDISSLRFGRDWIHPKPILQNISPKTHKKGTKIFPWQTNSSLSIDYALKRENDLKYRAKMAIVLLDNFLFSFVFFFRKKIAQ